jgi:hypothetical protein
VPGLRRSRAAGALRITGTALAAAVLTSAVPTAGPAWAAGPAIGPVQINPVGHPRLCWQAGGNGSDVMLERCDPALAGQQWSLTGNGVVMNGNGYCLEAGPAAALYIDFAGQCAGEGPGNGHTGRGQVWQYRAGQLASAGTGACAGPGSRVAAGAPVVRRPCSSLGPAGARWSIGYSAVTVAPGPGPGGGPAGGTFTASATVANAASAQAAYGVAVTFTLPPQLAASALRVTGRVTGTSGWTCDVRTLTCTGTLPSGASLRVAITGRLPAAARPGTSYTVRARAAVTGTSQRRGTPRTATTSLKIPVDPAAPRPAAGIRSTLLTIAAGAAVLLLAGALLLFAARRRPRHAARRPRTQARTPSRARREPARSRARREPARRPHCHSRPRA